MYSYVYVRISEVLLTNNLWSVLPYVECHSRTCIIIVVGLVSEHRRIVVQLRI